MDTRTDFPADLLDLIGPVAIGEFNATSDRHKAGLIEWTRSLAGLTEAEFVDVAAAAIYESASVGRFRGNWEHEHYKATVCFRESARRHVAAGHDIDCRGWCLYSEAHAKAMRGSGHKPFRTEADTPCTCGRT